MVFKLVNIDYPKFTVDLVNAKIKILYLEYIAGDARLVDEILNKAGIGCEIRVVENKQEYRQTLKDFEPVLIIADDANPALPVIEAMNIMKAAGLAIPFIVLTDPHPQNLAVNIVNAMKAGACDYLLKERIGELPRTVLSTVKKHNNESNIQLIEQNYRRIVETAQEGIWIINENLETIFVNQKMCEILEYPAEEIMGKHNYDFKPYPDIAITLSRIGNGKSDIIETHESEYITKSGKRIFCIVATNGLFDTDGKYIGRLAMMTDITHRKTSEDALRKSEANVSAIIENTPDLVYSLDTDLKFITYNQVFRTTMQAIYNFHVEQGGSTMDLIRDFDPEMAAKWMGIYAKALSGETLQFVNEYPFGDSKVYLSYSVNPIWESGKVIGLSCFSRDITRQKMDEVALRKSAANLTAITENTDAIIYSLDTELRYVAFNHKLKSTMQRVYDIEIKPGDKILDFLRITNPAEVLEWEEKYAVALKGEAIQFIKNYQVGSYLVYLSYSVNPIWENEMVAGLSCSVIDITKQKSDEIAVRKSEASLRTMFNNTDMSCVLIDGDHRIVSFNTLAQKLSVAQNQKEMQPGDSIFEFLDKERHETVTEMLEQTRNGTAMNYLVHKESEGINRWFDVTWAGIKDDDHQEMGHLFTIRDITAQKKLEIERERITTELLQRNKALEQFTYVISHNLRAPVANIIGLSSLMSDMDLKAEEVSTIVGSISQSAGKLDEVISDLNQVLQIEKDSNENVEAISLQELIDDIEFSIKNLIDKERVKIICNFDRSGEVVSVKTFMHSIFYNLILNSIKYRQPGKEPLILISTRAEDGKLLISYQDNGRGIDLTKHGHDIFGLYKRFDISVEGKGMGLFMVKMQVESLGGNIYISSTVNGGTTFDIEFLLAQ